VWQGTEILRGQQTLPGLRNETAAAEPIRQAGEEIMQWRSMTTNFPNPFKPDILDTSKYGCDALIETIENFVSNDGPIKVAEDIKPLDNGCVEAVGLEYTDSDAPADSIRYGDMPEE
jgi:hypothetical protein